MKIRQLDEIYKYYDQEINNIRDQITMGNISYYKGLLLMKKLLLIAYIYQEITKQINKSDTQEKMLYIYIAVSALLIALISFLFKSFGLIILLAIAKLPLDSKVYKYLSESKHNLDDLAIRYNESVDKLNNTNQLLTRKLNNKIPEQEIIEDKDAIIDLYLSNIENSEVINKMPEEYKSEAAYILQQDLGVEITDYDELIKLAQEKISDEAIKRELKIIN